MVSQSRTLNDLLVALTAAGVPVNLQVESQANPNLLVGIRQGALQAFVKAAVPSGFDNALVVRQAPGVVQTVQLSAGVTLAANQLIGLQAIDDVSFAQTSLNAHSFGAGIEALDVAPVGSQSQLLQQEAATFELQTVQHVGSTGIDPRKPDPGINDTTAVTGAITSIGALGLIAQLAVPVTGNYQVNLTAGAMGTVGVGDLANIRFLVKGAAVSVLANPTGSVARFGPFRASMATTDLLQLKSVAAGTVNSVYLGTIEATKTG